MTGAAGTVSAGPAPPPDAPVPSSPATEPVVQHAGDSGPTQSFTEVLSEQRGGAHRPVAGRQGASHQEGQDGELVSSQGGRSDPTTDETVEASLTGPQLVLESVVSVAPSSDPSPQGAGIADAVGLPLSGADEPAPVDVSVLLSNASVPAPGRAAAGFPATVEVVPDQSPSPSPLSLGSPTPSPVGAPSTPAADDVAQSTVESTPTDTVPTLPARGPVASVPSVIGPPPPPHGTPVAGVREPAGAGAMARSVDPPSIPVQTSFGRDPDPPIALATAVASHAPETIPRAGPVTGPAAPLAELVTSPLDVDGLSGALSRPLGDGNGAYTVTVAMHPPELGHLQAVMSLDGNDLSVSLTAQTQKGHDALSQAADALKNQLARGGINVSVSLRDPGSRPDADQRRHGATTGRHLLVPEATTETPALSPATSSGQIHLVL